MPPFFDGHNDALLRLSRSGSDPVAAFAAGPGHITLEHARAGGLRGGFFAMFALGPVSGLDFAMFDTPPYDTPLPAAMDRLEAWEKIHAQAVIAGQLEAAGALRLVRRAADVTLDEGADAPMTAVLHLEGAECIAPDLEGLDALYDMGLRSLGPVWSRPTAFAHGVPFRFPADGDIGPGLTPEGRGLVRALRARGMVTDLSHMNVKGFWDVADEGVPLVATHSNAHTICPTARNLTDDQLRAIGETGGMVGLNFGTMFLRPDGKRDPKGALDHVIPHLAHMIEFAGEDHVGLGSDFDGAPMPEGLPNAAALPGLEALMAQAGFGAELIAKITHRNWLDCLKRHLNAA